MIRSENYGGGHRWYCTNCDTGDNWYGRPSITWTNSTPPKYCTRCDLQTLAYDLLDWLKSEYKDKAVLPGSTAKIAELIQGRCCGADPHRVAAMINQLARKRQQILA
jgi:hypothetical protein